jgi:AsmA protein
MQQIDPIPSEDREPGTPQESTESPRTQARTIVRRVKIASLVVVGLLGLALLPPLINVNRFQRRIATSISGSIGRPVHLDQVSLSLLPLPGFEIQNLVVDEDPAFGAEPIIRANTVRATLRLSSLWRRRVEFSTISFTEPSVNLVHMPDGKWNIESILLQASHIDTAPTGQKRAGTTPRFPYIEATGARLNFKQGHEKMPFSLTESEFALWSPDPNQWHIRMQARPARTDSSATDTGSIEVEGTLGRGNSLSNIPVNLEGQWKDAPLGEASRVLTGDDAGWRGNMVLTANIRGTLGESAVTTRLRLLGVRRADFVPQQPLSAEVQCFATAMAVFHSYMDVRCAWPPSAAPDAPTIALTGEIPDVRNLEKSQVQFGSSGIPASTVINWLRIASAKISPDIAATGTLTGSMTYDGAVAHPWTGQVLLHNASLKTVRSDVDSLLAGDVALRAVAPTSANSRLALQLMPVAVALGGRDPATLEGHFDDNGYTLHLTGMATEARMQEFATAMAPLGTGLVDPPPPAAEGTAVTETAAAPVAATAERVDRVDRSTAASWSEPHTWNNPAPRQPQTASNHRVR